MSVHVSQMTGQIEMSGVAGQPGAQPGPAASTAPPPGWAERQRFDDLVRERERQCGRVAAGGFDG